MGTCSSLSEDPKTSKRKLLTLPSFSTMPPMHPLPSIKTPTHQHHTQVLETFKKERAQKARAEMASSSSIVVLLLSLNLLFFTLVSANSVPCAPKHKPKPKPTPQYPPYVPPNVPKYPPYLPYPKCPRDALKLAACANLLGGLVNLVVGPGSSHCCGLLEGLADVDAAACLCTVIKANVLGINLNIPLSLSLLLNACGRVPPEGYKCA